MVNLTISFGWTASELLKLGGVHWAVTRSGGSNFHLGVVLTSRSPRGGHLRWYLCSSHVQGSFGYGRRLHRLKMWILPAMIFYLWFENSSLAMHIIGKKDSFNKNYEYNCFCVCQYFVTYLLWRDLAAFQSNSMNEVWSMIEDSGTRPSSFVIVIEICHT